MRRALLLLAAMAIGCGGGVKGSDQQDELLDPGSILDKDKPDGLLEPGDTNDPDELDDPNELEEPDRLFPGRGFDPRVPTVDRLKLDLEDLVPLNPGDDGGLHNPPDGGPGYDCHRDLCAMPTCFLLQDEKNISKVFIEFGDCELGDFRVFAATPFTGGFVEVTDRLREGGGCCGEIVRDFSFNLVGPDRCAPHEVREAVVCIEFEDYRSEVRVGYHAGGSCVPGVTKNAGQCAPCGDTGNCPW
jgi:hypothetical protein